MLTRKRSLLILVTAALLALGSTAFSVFAKSPGADAQTHFAHTYFHIKTTFSPSAVPSGLAPVQFKRAYGIDQLANNGAGVTIAIVDAFGNPNAQADLNTYDATFNLPSTTITVVYPQGKPRGTIDQGWALETNLDLQIAHAVAPAAKLVLEATLTPSLSNLLGGVKDAYTKQGAGIISMSFGGSESSSETSSSADGIFLAGTDQGVSFTASSGDSGSGVEYPAASPYVTAVGGTTLHTQTNGTYAGETAWSGSGGGVSRFESRPTYQNGFNTQQRRGIPDVAMVADPNTGVSVYDSFGFQGRKGFFVLGGTSVASPMFAGVLALARQTRTAGFKNANKQIYEVASTRYATDFHDITTGSNGNCGAVCTAHPGYDLVTGLGSPAANRFVPDLIAAP